MKSQIKITTITAFFALISGLTIAQERPVGNTPPPPAGGPSQLPPHPGRHKGGPERGQGLKALTTLNGKVIAYPYTAFLPDLT